MEFIDNFDSSAIILIVLGVIILIVAIFGYFGACKGNPCMMYTYGTLLALILLTLIGVIVTMVVFRDDIEDFVTEGCGKGFKDEEGCLATLKDYSNIAIGVVVGIAILNILAVIIGFYHATELKKIYGFYI